MKSKVEEAIKVLADRSKDTDNAANAMNFAQAALNLAHVLATIDNLK